MQNVVSLRSVQRFDNSNQLRKGDHVRRLIPVWGVYHHGIACGDGTVIEYTKGTPCTIRRRSLAEFAVGNPIEIVNYSDPEPAKFIMRRALSRVGESCYHLLWNNCEDFATWCMTGRAESLQVSAAVRGLSTSAGLGGGLMVAALCGAGPVGLLIGALLGLGTGAAAGEGLVLVRDTIAQSYVEPSPSTRPVAEWA